MEDCHQMQEHEINAARWNFDIYIRWARVRNLTLEQLFDYRAMPYGGPL